MFDHVDDARSDPPDLIRLGLSEHAEPDAEVHFLLIFPPPRVVLVKDDVELQVAEVEADGRSPQRLDHVDVPVQELCPVRVPERADDVGLFGSPKAEAPGAFPRSGAELPGLDASVSKLSRLPAGRIAPTPSVPGGM